MRSVRQECLDHLVIFQEKQLQRVLHAYVASFNQARPHQGMGQQIASTEPISSFLSSSRREGDRSSSRGWTAP